LFSLRWTTSVAVSFLCFQLAAGQSLLTTAVQTLNNTINSSTTAVQTQAAAATQQLQAAANATIQNITSQVQAALNCSQGIAASIIASSEQAVACLNQKLTSLTAIANASRK
jgi:hypothetical protein